MSKIVEINILNSNIFVLLKLRPIARRLVVAELRPFTNKAVANIYRCRANRYLKPKSLIYIFFKKMI